MAGRKVFLNNVTGRVDEVRSCTVQVVREPGDFFSCFIKKKLLARDQDIDVAVQPIENPSLRRRTAQAFCAQDPPEAHLRQVFKGFKVEPFWLDEHGRRCKKRPSQPQREL